MGEVQRWGLARVDGVPDRPVEPTDEGPWMKYDDHVTCLSENKTLRSALADAQAEVERLRVLGAAGNALILELRAYFDAESPHFCAATDRLLMPMSEAACLATDARSTSQARLEKAEASLRDAFDAGYAAAAELNDYGYDANRDAQSVQDAWDVSGFAAPTRPSTEAQGEEESE